MKERPETIPKFKVLARIAWGFTAAIILTGLVYGRKIEQSFPEFFASIIEISLGLAVALLAAAFFAIKRSNLKLEINVKFILLAALLVIFEVFVCESTIVTSAERIHFIKYGAFSFFCFLSLNTPGMYKRAVYTAVLSSCFGTLEEYLQIFVPNRYFDTRDIMLNVVASVLASCICLLLSRAISAYVPQNTVKK